jgi:hypothetical protein
MTATGELARSAGTDHATDCTLVWIDAREAVIGHWHDGEVRLERLHSDVPSRHRATGHVRHDPAVRHGGGGAQDAGEANRLEHLARFIDLVANHVPRDGELLILGPGTVRDRLGHRIRETERHTSGAREVAIQTAGRLTEPQLVARLRHLAGADQRRRTLGAHRWTETPSRHAPGLSRRTSRHATAPPPIEIDGED